MADETDSEIKKEIEKLELEFKKIDLERKISECKKKKAEADGAMEPSEIELEKERSELEKQIAEAEKDTLKAKLPDSEVKPLEGKLTVDDDVAIECQIIAYRAMFEIAAQIGKEISKIELRPDRIIICDQNDISALSSYKTFKEQISILKKQYEEEFKEYEVEEKTKALFLPTAAVMGGTTILKSLIDFASLFRTNTEIKGKKIDIVNEALIAEVAKALKPVNIKTIYPAFKTTSPTEFLMDISELSNFKKLADQKIKENASNEGSNLAHLKDLNDQYGKILTALTGVDEKIGTSRLEKVLQGETLDSELNNENMDITDILYLKAVVAGGNNNIKRNILWSELSHSGGAIITYFLINKDGDIKASKNYYNLRGYSKFRGSGSEILNNNNFGE